MPTPSLTSLASAVLHLGRAPERVLEVECREGEGTLFLAREYPQARVRGLERSADVLRPVQARIGLDPEGRLAFKQGSPRSLPFPADNFDLVVQRHGRVHPAEVARVLRGGGHLVLVGMRQRLLPRRLRRRGFTTVRCGEAQGEPFLVARLDI